MTDIAVVQAPQRPIRDSYRFDRWARAQYLGLLRDGFGRQAAARRVGVSPKTVSNRMSTDPEFRQLVGYAEMEADDAVQNALFARAIDGHVEAQKFWLTNRRAQEWGAAPLRRFIDSSGAPIAVDSEFDLEDLRAEGLEMIRQLVERNNALATADTMTQEILDVESEEVLPVVSQGQAL